MVFLFGTYCLLILVSDDSVQCIVVTTDTIQRLIYLDTEHGVSVIYMSF